jgi:DNA-binding response OmpR family regulator
MAKRILVIDDEPLIADMVKMRLESAGYEVITANDGMQGLEKARKEKPDLIVLDVMMPKLDGYKVCRMLKFDERFKNTPIIICTARGQDSDKQTGGEVGADVYITKSSQDADLLNNVKKLLGE